MWIEAPNLTKNFFLYFFWKDKNLSEWNLPILLYRNILEVKGLEYLTINSKPPPMMLWSDATGGFWTCVLCGSRWSRTCTAAAGNTAELELWMFDEEEICLTNTPIASLKHISVKHQETVKTFNRFYRFYHIGKNMYRLLQAEEGSNSFRNTNPSGRTTVLKKG